MIITKRDHAKLLERSLPIKHLIEELVACPESVLASKLNALTEWEKPKGDLCQWIPLLNRLDEILERFVEKYNLGAENVSLREHDHADEEVVVAGLNCTALLLRHCSNKHIYDSASHLYRVIGSSSVTLRLATLRVLVLVAETACVSHSTKHAASPEEKARILALARFFPPTTNNYSGDDHIGLYDCIGGTKKIPSKWKALEFEYYAEPALETARPAALSNAPATKANPASCKKRAAPEGLCRFTLLLEELRGLTLPQIYDRALVALPPATWFQFGLRAPVAKAFNTQSFDALQLRQDLVQMRCLAIAFIVCVNDTSLVTSQLFEFDPYIFSYLVDLITPANRVARPVYAAAVKALSCIAFRRTWSGDIVRALSANVSHGVLFQILKAIYKGARDNDPSIDDAASVELLVEMLGRLLETKSLALSLVSAGLLNHLLDFLSLQTPRRRITNAALYLLDALILTYPEMLGQFVELDGFSRLVSTIGAEVDFAINNPGFAGGRPAGCIVHYEVSFRQAQYFKMLLKFVLHLLQTDTSDRMRNLFDSPLLLHLNKIIERPTMFGPTLITGTLNVLTTIIHNEPTSYAILHEAGSLDVVLTNYQRLFGPSSGLFTALVEVVEAICLNAGGLQRVVELDIIPTFFSSFLTPEYSKDHVRAVDTSNTEQLGSLIEALARHYEPLRPVIVREIKKLAEAVPRVAAALLPGTTFYQSPLGSMYMHLSEPVVNLEESCPTLEEWEITEGSFMVDRAALFLQSVVQETGMATALMQEMPFAQWLDLLTVRNAPYDFVFSDAILSVTGVLKYLDEEDRGYGLEEGEGEADAGVTIVEALLQATDRVHLFLSFDREQAECSVFQHLALSNKHKEASTLLQNLTHLLALLVVFMDIYCNPYNLFPIRVSQLARLFAGEQGQRLMTLMGALFRTCALEEMLIRATMPDEATTITSPPKNPDVPPLQFSPSELSATPVKNDKNSAKYKNLVQIRFLTNRILVAVAACFSAVAHLPMMKKQEAHSPKANLVATSNHLAQTLISMMVVPEVAQVTPASLSLDTATMECSYVAVVVNLLVFVLTGKSRGGQEHLQTVLAICLMQQGGFITARTLLCRYWSKLYALEKPRLECVQNLKYLPNTLECATLVIISQLLSLFTKILNGDQVEKIPSVHHLYENGIINAQEVSANFVVQSKLLLMGFLETVMIEASFDEEIISRLTPLAIHRFLEINRLVFSNNGELHVSHAGALAQLELTKSPKEAYLYDLGLTEKGAAVEFVKHHDVYDIAAHQPAGIDDAAWEAIVARAQAQPYVRPEIRLVPPQHKQYRFATDLDELRASNRRRFLDLWLLIPQYSPKSVFKVHEMIDGAFIGSDVDVPHVVLEYLYSFDPTNSANTDRLASMLILLSLFLNDDKTFYQDTTSELVDEFMGFLVDVLLPEYANEPWFSKALLVFERILAFNIPPPEPLQMETRVRLPKVARGPVLGAEVSDTCLERLLLVGEITNIDTGISLARVLLLYAAENEGGAGSDRGGANRRVKQILASGLLKRILLTVPLFAESDKFFILQETLSALFRRCFESAAVLKQLMAVELRRVLATKGRFSGTHRDIQTLVKETSAMVTRSADVYVEVAAEIVRIHDCTNPLTGVLVVAAETDGGAKTQSKVEPQTETNGEVNVEMVTEPSGEVNVEMVTEPSVEAAMAAEVSTGIVDLLVMELMAAKQHDWFKAKDAGVKKPPVEDPALARTVVITTAPETSADSAAPAGLLRLALIPAPVSVTAAASRTTGPNLKGSLTQNPQCAYACFLLQTLTELLASYKLAKVELLSFSKKRKAFGLSKARSTSLNFFLHQLLPTHLLEAKPCERRAIIAQLTTMVILALVASPLGEDGAKEDAEMLFIRKFTIDALSRVLASAIIGPGTARIRYSHVVDLVRLSERLVQRDSLGLLGKALDKGSTELDCYYMARVMLDKGLPAQILGVVTDIDFNFPEARMVTRTCIAPLRTLCKVKLQFQELFRSAGGVLEEEGEEDAVSDDGKEDTPDLFKNSTLGMYDVEDDEEDDDEDDGFGRQPLEVVYSEDDDSELDDSELEGVSDIDMDEGEGWSGGSEEAGEVWSDVSMEGGSEAESNAPQNGSDADLGASLDLDSDASSLESEITFDDDFDDLDDISVTSDAALDEWMDNYASDGEEPGPPMLDDDDDEGEDEDEEDSEIDSETGDYAIVESGMGNFRRGSRSGMIEDLMSAFGELSRANAGSVFEGAGGDAISILDRLFDKKKEKVSLAPNLNIKSTLESWRYVATMFSLTPEAYGVVPAILNRVFDDSMVCAEARRDAAEKARVARTEKREVRERVRRESEASRVAPVVSTSPILMLIGGREVDISGTDIDPDFFEALPEDMREEVFTQHIRARRAEATVTGGDTREIDPQFLEALPVEIRDEILHQEAMASRFADAQDEDDDDNDDDEDEDDDEGGDDENDTEGHATAPLAGSNRLYFTPLVDRAGVASLVKLVFLPQTFKERASLHSLMEFLCSSKQSRTELLGMLVLVLEATAGTKALEKCFHQLGRKKATGGSANGVAEGGPGGSLEGTKAGAYPVGSSPLVVATQTLEALQYLVESYPHTRFYFLVEHEPRKEKRRFKDSVSKEGRYPINGLLSFGGRKLAQNEPILMDLLSRIVQVATRPLATAAATAAASVCAVDGSEGTIDGCEGTVDGSEGTVDASNTSSSATSTGVEITDVETAGVVGTNPHLTRTLSPLLSPASLHHLVSILIADECSSRTFQQVLGAMQNLSATPHAKSVFPRELSAQASRLAALIVSDLQLLEGDITRTTLADLTGETINKFVPPSSDQAKLLRVLTALDYLFPKEELGEVYSEISLGGLWGALSECLRVLAERPVLGNVATVLLPLIEALMVVCKHQPKGPKGQGGVKTLFVAFTDEHKKILNLMVRVNPKLMSGPFAMLVKNPRVLEFDNKRNYFERQLHKEADRPLLSFTVDRNLVFLDSYRALFFKSELKNSKLDVKFKGEDGVDAGGVTREWYQVLSRQMFNPDYALFAPVDKTTFHPNRTSWVNPEHLSFFKFIGRIIGKALYDGFFLDCHFSRAVYKQILGRPLSLKDMETLDPEYFKSLIWMLENDITDIIIEDFSVETDDYGEHRVIDLIPGGRNVPVTEANKHDYVQKVVDYRLQTSIAEQMDNFLQGFHDIIPRELIAIFDEQELELLVSGLPDIDVDDWKNHTTYVNYTTSSPQIQWFWRAVRSFDVEERAKLLQFATGTSKVPLNGFKELSGVNGVAKFSIHRDYGKTDRLPSSHTCFNQVDIPEYDSYEKLRALLLMALTEGHEGFGLA